MLYDHMIYLNEYSSVYYYNTQVSTYIYKINKIKHES